MGKILIIKDADFSTVSLATVKIIVKDDIIEFNDQLSHAIIKKGINCWATSGSGLTSFTALASSATTSTVWISSSDVLKESGDFVLNKSTVVPGYDLLCVPVGINGISITTSDNYTTSIRIITEKGETAAGTTNSNPNYIDCSELTSIGWLNIQIFNISSESNPPSSFDECSLVITAE